jgi:hypothetical protein
MDLDGVFQRYIGRVVAFVLAPILVPASAAVAVWAQDVVGINLDPNVLVAYVSSVAIGVAAIIYKWLHNNGLFENAVVELHSLYRAGSELEPPPPPRAA